MRAIFLTAKKKNSQRHQWSLRFSGDNASAPMSLSSFQFFFFLFMLHHDNVTSMQLRTPPTPIFLYFKGFLDKNGLELVFCGSHVVSLVAITKVLNNAENKKDGSVVVYVFWFSNTNWCCHFPTQNETEVSQTVISELPNEPLDISFNTLCSCQVSSQCLSVCL